MKTLLIAIFLLTVTYVFSQNGKIEIKNSAANPEDQTTFIFKPPTGLYLPEDLLVHVSCSDFSKKTFPLEEKGSVYEFSFKLPASSNVFFFAVSDSKQDMVDNNSGEGYVVYLKDPSSEGFENTIIERIRNCTKAGRYLKLKYTNQDMIDQFESAFETYPYLKYDSRCAIYYFIKFFFIDEFSRSEMLEYAEIMASEEDEESLTSAYGIYGILDMDDKRMEVAMVALEKYPKGHIAKSKLMDEYFSFKEKSETYIEHYIDEYKRIFEVRFDNNLRKLYMDILDLYLQNKDTLNLAKYEEIIPDKNFIASVYNWYAREASGMDFAELISRKSLDIVGDKIKHPEADDDVYLLQEKYIMCSETYALILYKQKKYDSAFQYQHQVLEALGDGMDIHGKERYAACAEKARGPEFAREYLEKQLLAGADSKVMIDQLQNIYSKLNLPENEFENIKKQYIGAAAEKDREEIIEKFGDIKAIDFTLTNLDDEKVTLSDYRGKVVVLDFWATWCGPCKSSFPKMQEIVTKYENENVEFFFINSWERQEPEKTREKVTEFIEAKGYNFNVLFDYNNNVINKYKVQGIPETILIDKLGNIKYIGYYTDLPALIDENLIQLK